MMGTTAFRHGLVRGQQEEIRSQRGDNRIWQADDVMFHPGVGRLSVISSLAPQLGALTLSY